MHKSQKILTDFLSFPTDKNPHCHVPLKIAYNLKSYPFNTLKVGYSRLINKLNIPVALDRI